MKITIAGLGCVGSSPFREPGPASPTGSGLDSGGLPFAPAESGAAARPAARSPEFGLRRNGGKPRAA